MKKRSKKSPKNKMLLSAVLILIALAVSFILISSTKLKIKFSDNKEIGINEQADNYQFIESIKNGKILTEKTPIDTSSLGEKNISITVKPVFGSRKVFNFTVSVVDNQCPEISFTDRIEINIGDKIDLLKNVTVTDNSGEDITAMVEGDYDIKTLGEYKLKYTAVDSSSNKTEEEFILAVIDNEGPIIKFTKNLSTTKGKDINLLYGVTASDNSGEKITVTVEGDYDINKIGTYELKYTAVDSSSNKTEEKFTLQVTSPDSNSKTEYFTTSKDFKGVKKNGVTYIDGYLIANKTYSLPSSYGSGLTSETKSAFNKMTAAAKKDGLKIWIKSGFRSYNTQKYLYNRYVKRDGKAEADTYSARAGYSEHQSGLALDVNTINSSFIGTPEAIWLEKNCYKYGFILRYPKGKTNETGYIYEPWHFRYVGKELAEKLYNNGDWITMEDYFGITSVYQ